MIPSTPKYVQMNSFFAIFMTKPFCLTTMIYSMMKMTMTIILLAFPVDNVIPYTKILEDTVAPNYGDIGDEIIIDYFDSLLPPLTPSKMKFC